MAHKFVVGQIVDLTRTILRQAVTGGYEILRLLPVSDKDPSDPSYRVKSVGENHERVVHESEISLSTRAASVFP
jgi:hypothetical protein